MTDETLTDEKLWHLQHCPLFSGVSKQEMEHLRDVTAVSYTHLTLPTILLV